MSYFSKKNKKYWYSTPNYSSKPPKFTVIDGKERIYSSLVSIYSTNTNQYFKHIFKYKQDLKTREIDKEFLKNELVGFFGYLPRYNINMFERDGGPFNFLQSITIDNAEVFINMLRQKKLEKINKE